MNKIKKNILDLLLILFVTTCQQAEVSAVSINTPMAQMTSTETATPAAALTAFPTSELAPYYGTPQPAKVIVNNKAYESEIGTTIWNPDYKTQAYIEQTDLPLLSEQPLTFSLQPGIYVYEVHSGWGGSSPHTELEADFGFLPEVQE